ncbi:hypothetical protein GCM10010363_46680 [Streptomyces omiyaensis]|nr:hypothetical protein GCM10010363_46680 [Streptomyces omiyaensis]
MPDPSGRGEVLPRPAGRDDELAPSARGAAPGAPPLLRAADDPAGGLPGDPGAFGRLAAGRAGAAQGLEGGAVRGAEAAGVRTAPGPAGRGGAESGTWRVELDADRAAPAHAVAREQVRMPPPGESAVKREGETAHAGPGRAVVLPIGAVPCGPARCSGARGPWPAFPPGRRAPAAMGGGAGGRCRRAAGRGSRSRGPSGPPAHRRPVRTRAPRPGADPACRSRRGGGPGVGVSRRTTRARRWPPSCAAP